LIIFALGFLINTLTGPCGYVMMMTGAESIFLRYTLVANIASVLGAGIMIGAGMEWAAIAIVLASIGQNIAAAIWSRRNAGVEATILCLWSRPNPPSV
jgi:O-antigen/teichoic acid export membrane protein